MDKLIYFFGENVTEGDPERKDILGGKGASLAAMSRAKLPVPPGFTISTECCRLYLQGAHTWPAGLEEETRASLARLEELVGRRFGDGVNPLLVSVRSGAAHSMPGMMDTILNCGLSPEAADAAPDPVSAWRVYTQFAFMFVKTVAGVEAKAFDEIKAGLNGNGGSVNLAYYKKLFQAYSGLYLDRTGKEFPLSPWPSLVECINAVFTSWNNDRAITYRREHDIRGLIGTAVNVQVMFPSRISGIVFTMNPNNAGSDEMIIESSFGLGEAIVSGDVHPDNLVLNRKTLEVTRRFIGHKESMVAALGDMEVRDPDAPSLNDAQIRELAEMSLRVEAFFGKPMDLEWGWADGRFALLQSRSIRGLEIVEDMETGRKEEIYRLREMASGKRRVWVLHNLAETLPAPTPLTWAIVKGFMSGNGGFGRMYRDFGYCPSAEVMEHGFLELICGRIYADTARAADLFWDGMPMGYDLEAVIKDTKLMDAAPTRFDPERATGAFFLKLPKFIGAMRRSSKLMKAGRREAYERFEEMILPAYRDWVAEKRAQVLTGKSTSEVLEELDLRIEKVLNEFAPESLKPGFFGGLAQAGMEALLTQLMGREKGMHLTLTLTQGLEGDTTIEQNQWLWELAHGKRTRTEFLERFGHRTIEEMELSKARWREDDSYIKQVIGAFLGDTVVEPHMMHEKNADRRRTAERDLPATLAQWGGRSRYEDLLADIKDAQTLLPYRESGKHYLMMGYETVRQAIVELARRWDLGRDIFFLTLEELKTYESATAKCKECIDSRKIRWQSAKRLDMPEVVDSNDMENLGFPRHYAAATELHGEAIAAGISTGIAQLVADPMEATGLCQDYVLVCHSTDPGWTALFVHAKGLVVEQGGILSHGAIVARDFGIPAVVCPDAMRRIAHGATIRVDGNRGLITIIEQPSDKSGV